MSSRGRARLNGRRRSCSDSAGQSGPNNPAVNTTGANNANNPVAGANSFTEGQAKSRMETGGYSNVSALKKDDQGVWRAKAMKDGKSVDVSLDFQGNVVAR